MPPRTFHGEPEGTREELMQATYRALCEYGYAELTIERIGEEFEKSVSLVYHHYDGKDELLVDFLGFMLEEFEAASDVDGDADPRERLWSALERARLGPLDEDAEFASALTVLRVQSAHDPAYRQQFDRSDRLFRERYAEIIRSGIEQGVFREVDPESVADLLVTTIDGAILKQATTDLPVEPVLDELGTYVRTHLLAEPNDEP